MNPSQLNNFAQKILPAFEKTSRIARKTRNYNLLLAAITIFVGIATTIYTYTSISASYWALIPLGTTLIPLVALGIVFIVLDDIIGAPEAIKTASSESIALLKENWKKLENTEPEKKLGKMRHIKKSARILWESSSVFDGVCSARFIISPIFWLLVAIGNVGALLCIFCLLLGTFLHFTFAG